MMHITEKFTDKLGKQISFTGNFLTTLPLRDCRREGKFAREKSSRVSDPSDHGLLRNPEEPSPSSAWKEGSVITLSIVCSRK